MVYDYYLREDSNGEKFLLRWDSQTASPWCPIGSVLKEIDYQQSAIIMRIEAYPGDWKALLTKIVREHQEIIAILERYL